MTPVLKSPILNAARRLAALLLLLFLAISPKISPCWAQDDNYVLAPDDLLELKVFQEENLDAKVRVSTDGTIILPLIESVKVGGMTVAQATNVIKARYHAGYLVNPQVSIAVLEFSKRLFTILGQVQKPGSYDFPDNRDLNLLQAVGYAGGYTKLANQARIVVRRNGTKGEQTFKLNAKAMARDNASVSFKVLPNDVITVGETLF